MTDEEILKNLKKLAIELGKSPSAVDCNNCTYTANTSTYQTRFGSWNKAKELANIENTNKFAIKSEDELILSLKTFYNKNGRAPTQRECRSSNGLYGPNTYKDNFGGWNKALEVAGISPNILRSNQVSDKELLDSLIKFYTEEGRAPRHEDCNNTKEYRYLKAHMIYKRRFGTFSRALELAEVPLNKPSIVSKAETDLVEEIKKFYSGKIVTSQRILPNNREIDIYFPKKNLGIEFNGLYWHSEQQGKYKNYHLQKTKDAAKLGIRLIHIFESEWVNQRELVLSRLKNILVGYSERIYARKCIIKEIETKEAKDFLIKNHIQGYTGASIKLGLYYQKELVAIQTFGKARFSNTEWELIRYASKQSISVVGGASKLFKYFLRNYNPSSIISYSDKRWNTGKLYSNLGFKYTHDSTPNYWYFKGLQLESRVKYQKHKLHKVLEEFEPKWTEVENMYYNGYNRIFDCGNSVFLWTR